MRADGRRQRGKGHRKGNNPEGRCKGNNTRHTYTGTSKENNYILSFFPDGKKHGIAAADVSTGEFIIYETFEPIEDEFSRFEPKEIYILIP